MTRRLRGSTTSTVAEAAARAAASIRTHRPHRLIPVGLVSSNFNTSAAALTADCHSKRTFPCRICGTNLSSSSNRLRHERVKHQSAQQIYGSSAAGGTAAQPDAACAATSSVAAADSAADNHCEPAAEGESSFNADHEAQQSASAAAHSTHPAATSMSHNAFSLQAADGAVSMDVDDSGSSSSARCSSSDSSDSAEPEPAAVAQIEGAVSSAATEPQQLQASPSLLKELTCIEGVSPSLQESELQGQCYPFLCWLTEPPLTPCEALVKARRVKSLSQLQPIKNTLRFIFVLLHELHIVEGAPELSALSTLSVCQQLYSAMQARQAGHARLHAIFLLVKKILVFLSSKESAARRQFLLPSSVSESYLYVDGICSDSGFRRKQEARNRSLLGVAASRQLRDTQAASAAAAAALDPTSATGPVGFQVPRTWSTSSSAAAALPGATSAAATNTGAAAAPSVKVQSSNSVQFKLRRVRSSSKTAAAADTSLSAPSSSSAAAVTAAQTSRKATPIATADHEASANEMTPAELQQVTQGCVQFLQQHSSATVIRSGTQIISDSMKLSQATVACAADTAAASCEPSCARFSADVHAQSQLTNSADGMASQLQAVDACAAAASALGLATQLSSPSNSADPEISAAPAAGIAATAELKLNKLTAAHAASPSVASVKVPAPASAATVADHVYMAYLVTALLCLCMAPRSQVLRQLQIGSSLVKEADGKYWVRLLADMCKNGKPTLFAVPELLTPIMDHYLEYIRPRMLARQPKAIATAAATASAAAAASTSGSAHSYFFCKTNGTAPRTEFSTCTSLVTMQLIGRPINAHAFRSAVITTFYSANASQADMDTLANIMSHDAATARNYYYRPQRMRAAEDTSQRMMKQLLPNPAHHQL